MTHCSLIAVCCFWCKNHTLQFDCSLIAVWLQFGYLMVLHICLSDIVCIILRWLIFLSVAIFGLKRKNLPTERLSTHVPSYRVVAMSCKPDMASQEDRLWKMEGAFVWVHCVWYHWFGFWVGCHKDIFLNFKTTNNRQKIHVVTWESTAAPSGLGFWIVLHPQDQAVASTSQDDLAGI